MPVMEPEVYEARLRTVMQQLHGARVAAITLHRATVILMQEWGRWARLGLVDTPHGPALSAFTVDNMLELALGPENVAAMERRMAVNPLRYRTHPAPFRVGPP